MLRGSILGWDFGVTSIHHLWIEVLDWPLEASLCQGCLYQIYIHKVI